MCVHEQYIGVVSGETLLNERNLLDISYSLLEKKKEGKYRISHIPVWLVIGKAVISDHRKVTHILCSNIVLDRINEEVATAINRLGPPD